MCQFCVKHGDGKKWYLQAENYAYDLDSDLRRREMMLDFVKDFDATASRALTDMERLKGLPGRLRTVASQLATRQMKRTHFGQPVPIEDCESIFEITTSIVRVPCVCREFSGAQDDAYCLAITTQPEEALLREAYSDYSSGPDTSAFEQLTDAEAIGLLHECEEQGMMHSVWTFITPFIAGLCNCKLADGCLAMRATLEYDVKCMWKGEYVAEVDPDLCNGCRACVELCPFGAIEFDEANCKAVVRLEECYGCGTCRAACSVDAISLTERAEVPQVAEHW